MPVMLAFQSILDVLGADPAEKRVNDSFPWNWGHSYWFKFTLAEVKLSFVWAFAAKLKLEIEAKTEKRSTTRIPIAKLFL